MRCSSQTGSHCYKFFNDPSFSLGFNRKFHGHSSLKEYYEKESCVHYIHNVSCFCIYLTLPQILFNRLFWSFCVCVFDVWILILSFSGRCAAAASELCR